MYITQKLKERRNLCQFQLNNSTFDADDNYAYLHRKNIMLIINLNPRNTKDLPQPDFNEIGVNLCPYDPSLPMTYDGITREKGRADRIKYICPKVKKTTRKGKITYILNCNNPCTTSKFGRIKNIIVHNNYRFNTSTPRDSLKWQKLYRIRTIYERSISQLIAFILMYKTKNYDKPLAIKSLIA